MTGSSLNFLISFSVHPWKILMLKVFGRMKDTCCCSVSWRLWSIWAFSY